MLKYSVFILLLTIPVTSFSMTRECKRSAAAYQELFQSLQFEGLPQKIFYIKTEIAGCHIAMSRLHRTFNADGTENKSQELKELESKCQENERILQNLKNTYDHLKKQNKKRKKWLQSLGLRP